MKSMSMKTRLPFAYFGTGNIAAMVLDELLNAGLRPEFIVSSPPRPAGRGNVLTPSPVAQKATKLGIDLLMPETLDDTAVEEIAARVRARDIRIFALADYGAIIPAKLLAVPEKGIVNMHPSLLPRLRGPSPIRSTILFGEKPGVSLMILDELMDHGPLLAQREVDTSPLGPVPVHGAALDMLLAQAGGALLAETLESYMLGKIEPHEQDHTAATYCTMFTKEMGELDLVHGDPMENLRKIRAFEGWPGTYAFFSRGDRRVRAKIIDAHLEGGNLIIDTVIPEGKAAMRYADFVRSGARPIAQSL